MSNETKVGKTIIPIDLQSLVPTEATLKLSTIKEELVLKKWTLKVKAHAIAHFGEPKLATIFKTQDMIGMAEIVYRFMLKPEGRKIFELMVDPDAEIDTPIDAFLESISSPSDQANMVRALVQTVGIGEEEVKKITEALKHEVNANSPYAIKEDETKVEAAPEKKSKAPKPKMKTKPKKRK